MQTTGKNTEIYAVSFKNGGGVSSLHALYGVVRVYHFDDLDWRIFSRSYLSYLSRKFFLGLAHAWNLVQFFILCHRNAW